MAKQYLEIKIESVQLASASPACAFIDVTFSTPLAGATPSRTTSVRVPLGTESTVPCDLVLYAPFGSIVPIDVRHCDSGARIGTMTVFTGCIRAQGHMRADGQVLKDQSRASVGKIKAVLVRHAGEIPRVDNANETADAPEPPTRSTPRAPSATASAPAPTTLPELGKTAVLPAPGPSLPVWQLGAGVFAGIAAVAVAATAIISEKKKTR
ncbi:hypothetical protein AMAG_11221 [Allomyces macrogynus ATCC 38327]|uniref:Uncharacterized protein n=1 Tax=Allomyces macrogynus (strain ATCC 38327) TaxID=578462 RepID=A0A0L0SVV2_ALLM3|nr:hypothetical protein AMAG_11221 [Allomyces macrogynus ATCC 38327]|eukprot:KNE66723.1 hypothetical protein AMAG_11221 [Allomyces macrogynus ATCC 38327]